MAALRKPRTECGCQPVAFTSSCKVTPPGRFSRSRILFVLVPLRGAVAAFFAPAALGAGPVFGGAALARRLATRAFPAGTAVAIAIFFFGVVILSVFLWRQSPRDDINPSVSSHMQ